MKKTNRIHTTIVTNMTDLCKWLNGETVMQKISGAEIEIVSMKPAKGISDEDIIKLEWCYLSNEEAT